MRQRSTPRAHCNLWSINTCISPHLHNTPSCFYHIIKWQWWTEVEDGMQLVTIYTKGWRGKVRTSPPVSSQASLVRMIPCIDRFWPREADCTALEESPSFERQSGLKKHGMQVCQHLNTPMSLPEYVLLVVAYVTNGNIIDRDPWNDSNGGAQFLALLTFLWII